MTTTDPYIKHSDIILVDEDKGTEYRAISSFLKCKSKYFDALLSTTWNPQENKKFKIKAPSCFENIIKWIFTGKLNVQYSELCDVYEFADMYQMDELITDIKAVLNRSDSLFWGKDNCFLRLDPLKSDFIFQPIFIDFLLKHRKTLVQYYFSQQPIFNLISKIVCCEHIHANTNFINTSHWAIQSASFNCLDFKNGISLSAGKDFYIDLLPGLKFRVTSFLFAPSLISLYGVRLETELIPIDSTTINDRSLFFTNFVLRLSDSSVQKIDVVINKIQIKGEITLNNDFWNFSPSK